MQSILLVCSHFVAKNEYFKGKIDYAVVCRVGLSASNQYFSHVILVSVFPFIRTLYPWNGSLGFLDNCLLEY